ncbi:MAG: hypothetical protein IJ192_07950 [Clostridia bacterium]|nr:hypothetical protein [Clostridia bacterium]
MKNIKKSDYLPQIIRANEIFSETNLKADDVIRIAQKYINEKKIVSDRQREYLI